VHGVHVVKRVRYPVVAGYFYPSRREDLVKVVEWSFKHRLGPGSLPQVVEQGPRMVVGYVVPHAGYIYSGPVAAHAYYDLARDGAPQTLVILGTNHTGLGKPIAVYPSGEWQTPLGSLEVDEELGKKVVEYSDIADLDEEAHLEEHSVEVQLPFIQYIYGSRVKILPLVIGIHTPSVAADLAESILRAARELGRDVVVLASSDFNHYEPHDVTAKKDEAAINKVIELDAQGFYNLIVERNISVCGPGGIMTLIEIARRTGAKAKLLKYATSGDVSGEKSAVVGYAAVRVARE
jgi:AmmeMemoRadiSam system protein B